MGLGVFTFDGGKFVIINFLTVNKHRLGVKNEKIDDNQRNTSIQIYLFWYIDMC